MTEFWGYALLIAFVVSVTASLVVAVIRLLLFAERKQAVRPDTDPAEGPGRTHPPAPVAASRPAGDPPAREALELTPEQTREFDREWTSLVSRLR